MFINSMLQYFKKKITRTSIFWFFTYLRFEILLGVFISINVGVLDALGLSMFIPMLQLFGDESSNRNTSFPNQAIIDLFELLGVDLNLYSVLFIMLLLFCFKGIAKYISFVYRVILQQKLIKRIRLELLNYFKNLKYAYFNSLEFGRLQNIMTSEVDRIQQGYSLYFQAIEQGILVIVYISFALFIDMRFSLIVVSGGMLSSFLYRKLYEITKQNSTLFSNLSNTYQGEILEYFKYFKYLKTSNFMHSKVSDISNSVDDIEKVRRKMGFISGILEAVKEPLLILVVSISIIIQIEIFGGDISTILLSLMFFYRALISLTSMQTIWNRYLEVSGSVDNVRSSYDDFKNNQSDLFHGIFINKIEKIELINVSYSIEDNLILNKINLSTNGTQKIAIVGVSGSGKSTILNIISGILDDYLGEIRVNNILFQNIDKKSFKNQIGYITQEPVIFKGSIFDNVTLFSEKNEQNIKLFNDSLKKASVFEFVKSLTDGYETIIYESGNILSGGQKQRINIARELFKNPKLLLIDEATSSLDTDAELIIQSTMENLRGKVMMFVVAHRLNTIKSSDKIILISQGKVEATGSFDNLIEKNLNFRNMVNKQKS